MAEARAEAGIKLDEKIVDIAIDIYNNWKTLQGIIESN